MQSQTASIENRCDAVDRGLAAFISEDLAENGNKTMTSIVDKVINRLRKALPVPSKAVRRMHGGYSVALRPRRDPHERQLYQLKTYEAGTLALMDRVLRPGDNTIDVGANLGIMSLHASQLVGPTGTVVAIEPHDGLFTRLCQNVTLNRLTNVRTVHLAAGAKAERRSLYDVPSVNIGRASLIEPTVPYVTAGKVDVLPLDEIVGGLSEIRFLKIDVEGFEPEVLKGATRTLAKEPIVCMEVTSAVDRTDDPLAAHDIIMETGLYHSFNFLFGKERPSPLVRLTDRKRLLMQVHDNVVYIPIRLEQTLPAGLFQ